MRKRSFLKIPVALEVERLLADYTRIPERAWQPSYWSGPHGSVDTLLLRGGSTDTAQDYCTLSVADRPLLATLPYFAWLSSSAGPFGQCVFAFVFRMWPSGLARLHRDGHPIWTDLFRVHIPLTTNAGARLVVEGERGQHFAVGEAWTFDNQGLHGVLNGETQRAHLILDVPASNAALKALLARAEHVEGEPVSATDWARLCAAEPAESGA